MQRQQIHKTVPIGKVYITSGAEEAISAVDINTALFRHICCDWGDVCDEDWELNNQAMEEGIRVLSSYKSSKGTKFWIITEADRSVTTILLPEDY